MVIIKEGLESRRDKTLKRVEKGSKSEIDKALALGSGSAYWWLGRPLKCDYCHCEFILISHDKAKVNFEEAGEGWAGNEGAPDYYITECPWCGCRVEIYEKK